LRLGQELNNVEITDESEIQAWVDQSALSKVLMNLIGNALAYLDDKSVHTINLVARRENKSVLFSIRDNGRGIPLADQESLFAKFKRGSNTQNRKGSGLGLAICKGIIEAHGGKIWFESKENIGTTFFFTLPDRAVGD